MAATVPTVTELTSGFSTWDAAEYIDEIYTHINASGTHLKVDDYNVGQGLTIGFVNGSETHQFNMRKNGADLIELGIEPSGSITDAGNDTPTSPTGTSADWSGEFQFDVTWGGTAPASGSKVWIVELVDAFFIVTTDPTNAFHSHIIHGGRIAVSAASSDAASQGQDGLGFIAGVPDSILNGSANDWLGTGCPSSTLHWATNEWSDHVHTIGTTQGGVNWIPDVTHTAYRPLGFIVCTAVDIDGTTGDAAYGVLKYLRSARSTQTPKTLWTDGASNQAFMHYNDTSAADYFLIIWDKTVTP